MTVGSRYRVIFDCNCVNAVDFIAIYKGDDEEYHFFEEVDTRKLKRVRKDNKYIKIYII